MKAFRAIFNFYINSSIHVAIAVYALSWISLLQYEIDYDENSLYFVFFSTIVAYNFAKYFGLVKFHYRRLAHWLKAIQIVSIISAIAVLFYVFRLQDSSIILVMALGLITFLYAIPLIPNRLLFDEQRNLREISGVKIYVIALVWALSTVILPLINNTVPITVDVVVYTVQRFLYVMVLMLPFEIRDLNYDNLKLATIPQKIGIKKTKLLGVILLIFIVVLEFKRSSITSLEFISTAILVIITLLFLMFSKKNQSKYYSSFWVEGLPLVWLLLLLVFA